MICIYLVYLCIGLRIDLSVIVMVIQLFHSVVILKLNFLST